MSPQPEFCQSTILSAPATPLWRPVSLPWPIKVHVLGGFRLERDGQAMDLGAKPPTRALDILRALVSSEGQACPHQSLQDWLWPDLDGDQAKAACDQALHRLRKLLGQSNLVVQREGKLRLAADRVWVDLVDWERHLKPVLASNAVAGPELEQLFLQFPGPLLLHERMAAWCLPAVERVRRGVIELAIRIGKHCEARNDAAKARTIYLRALDFYPDSVRIYKALIQGRIFQDDVAGAIEDYSSCERMLRASGDSTPSPELRALIRLLFARLAPEIGSGAQCAGWRRRPALSIPPIVVADIGGLEIGV